LKQTVDRPRLSIDQNPLLVIGHHMRDSVQLRSVRDAILDATDDMLSRFGYKKMTIDDLAHAVGIGKGTIYLHFTSKEEIALSHIDRIIERLKARLWDLAGSSISPEQKIRKMLVERVMYRFDSVQHYTTSLNELLAQLRPKLLERRKRYFEEEAAIFAKVLVDGRTQGLFAKNADDSAAVLLLATNSLLPYSLSTHELGRREEIEQRVTQIAEALLKGIIRR
jgi:AcrR family transcriptional regulator